MASSTFLVGAISNPSTVSLKSKTSLSSICCKICVDNRDEALFEPCRCSGTMGVIHQSCLIKWLALSGRGHCEICGYRYLTKNANNCINMLGWKKLEMNENESATFTASIISVAWFTGSISFMIRQYFLSESQPELFGPIYMASYGMICAVNILILCKYPIVRLIITIVSYAKAGCVCNSPLLIMPIKTCKTVNYAE